MKIKNDLTIERAEEYSTEIKGLIVTCLALKIAKEVKPSLFAY